MSMVLDLPRLREWIGRREEKVDILSPQLVAAFSATILDEAQAAETRDAAPAGIHWCLAQPSVPMSGLGEDGHPARGGFLPPVPLPRRMWAGSRVTFGERIRIGDAIERTSTVKEVQARTGATGQLCFVTVEHT
jgi:3-methylfumaryl-CoA hydratase